ncbi:NADH dehydrogenase [ubiquinone] 1 beta subcomplex subunit 8, mitochondrial [Diorhabda carinulata]|uniref:NADH dehydrogenase [ubiquinone] 1 beta subcomplex subunit 8, mitochondrial n=1 Tax=Diorhabda sublineata TaxID=1163346 RepID=UPI0024E134BC|nr:NADH dehydrogenase [ubiquinone] 1 beta subcomplex subunit 8, mitochondrial [Diorhabda sublineata]XP_057655348.1 NADH dehydrogenase [ubiquinone] 1 beta subcomplex subunit 8, mitochondrial [Diorhabda carinulata]
MSSLIKSLKPPKAWLKNNAILVTAIRNHWNKDYKPGPYPQTEEERQAAAEKYGLHPSEYEPYPDDGQGCGDYPKLPMQSIESRDPFYPWDNPELKRNFGETLHAEYDLLREDRYDVSVKLRRPMWFLWAQFLGVMFGTFGIYYLLENVKMFHSVMPRQYPKEGKVHYTFEPAE